MKYMGSKARIAKYILPIMLEEAEKRGVKKWIEPFVGGGNMIDKVPETFERIGYDNNRYLIDMYNHAKNCGIDYTHLIPKSVYDLVRDAYNKNSNTIDGQTVQDSYIGWVGFMASANGRFFDGGYSGKSNTKIGTVRDYISESIRGFEKQLPQLLNVGFIYDTYENLNFRGCLIYCDPPYKGTKTYNTSKNFDYEKFHNWCREQSKENVVFVSEYEMPNDFECVWQQEVKSSLSANGFSGGSKKSIEKLFKIG